MGTRIAILKLAAIGDVVLACRALTEFEDRFELDCQWHWFIDASLVGLAQKLTSGVKNQIEWHGVNASRLLRGSLREKSAEALRLRSSMASVKIDHLLLLHRDWRYHALLRRVIDGRILSVTRRALHELDTYTSIFQQLSACIPVQNTVSRRQVVEAVEPSGKIGMLLGGAQNQKLLFREKRWPRWREFLELVLRETDLSIVVLGSAEDIASTTEILSGLDTRGRVENQVGRLELSQLPDILKIFDAFISIDSGLAHIAASVMKAPHQRVLALFGPTNPRDWAPRSSGDATTQVLYQGVACSPCYENSGRFNSCRYSGDQFQYCMTGIDPRTVLAALKA